MSLYLTRLWFAIKLNAYGKLKNKQLNPFKFSKWGMKVKIASKILIMILVLMLIIIPTGCGKKSSSEEPSSSAPPISSSSEPEEEEDDDVEVERVFLIEKIDEGLKRNADTKGWLYIPNTEIDNQVLQGKDNDYYLRIDEDKNYSVFGCYYLDYACKIGSRDVVSKNTIIYGHSDLKDNKDGKKFSQLYKYDEIDFLKENPYIYFSTEDEDMVWQVFAVFYTNWRDFNYILADPSDATFESIIKDAKARSQYIIDIPVDKNDNILTLSTCSAYYNKQNPDDYRFVVMAKLLPNNEVSKTTMEVQPNPSPKKS